MMKKRPLSDVPALSDVQGPKSDVPDLGPRGTSDIGRWTLDEIEQFILDAGSDDLPTFGGRYEGGIHCQQIPDEFAQCILAILEAGEPINHYLEVGVAAGGTTFVFHHFFHPEQIVLVDDGGHPKASLRPGILKGIPRVEIVGNSWESEVVAEVGTLSRAFDLVLIDADHSYPGVRTDVENYLPLVRPGGVLLLHDSALPDFGVYRVKDELRSDARVEFVHEFLSAKRRPLGIAMFRKVAG